LYYGKTVDNTIQFMNGPLFRALHFLSLSDHPTLLIIVVLFRTVDCSHWFHEQYINNINWLIIHAFSITKRPDGAEKMKLQFRWQDHFNQFKYFKRSKIDFSCFHNFLGSQMRRFCILYLNRKRGSDYPADTI